jgi:hypothetical protein
VRLEGRTGARYSARHNLEEYQTMTTQAVRHDPRRESVQRYEQAEQHREGLRFTGAPRDDKVRITRYRDGVVVEIIEKRIKVDERIRKGRKRRKTIANFPSKTARTRAKLARERRKAEAAAVLDAAERAGLENAREPFDVETAYGVDVDGPAPFNFNLVR